ncbi:hypothetical protein NpNSSI1_00008690 [Neofusicoccum parvum]|nr:hypothetical protein NpNSSI1_00008690 [Neofusicoccum parvum]
MKKFTTTFSLNSGVFEAEFLQEYNLSYRSLISNDLQSNGIFPSTQGAQRSYDAPLNPRLLPPAVTHDSATWHRAQAVHPFRDLRLAPVPDAPEFSPLHNIDLLFDAPTRAPGPPPTASGTRPPTNHEPWLPAAAAPLAPDWQPLPDIPPPSTTRHPLGGAWETVAGADEPPADGVSPWSMVGSHEGLTPLSFELVSDGDDGAGGGTEASSGRASGYVTPDGSSPGSVVVVTRHSPRAPTTRVWEAPAQGSRKRKDGRLTDEAREKTKLVRRAKACVRCRMLKIEDVLSCPGDA